MITHRALRNLCAWHEHYYGHDPDDRVTLLTNVSFDAMAAEIWPHLVAGSSLHVMDDITRVEPARFIDFVTRHRITRCFLTTGLAQLMAEQDWPDDAALRFVFTGGDRLHWPRRPPPWQLVNQYGSTEATVLSTSGPVAPGPHRREVPPLGPPINNVDVYVLDAAMQPVPLGVCGEFYIGGECLGRGYLGRPGLTAQRWVPNPFGQPGSLLYRTGDLGRMLPDGQLDFVARLDDQVKIRGFRVEPGEIEAALRAHPGVSDAVVIMHHDAVAGDQLAAYVVGQAAALDRAALRDQLRSRLPGFMIPVHFIAMPELPLTAHGKVDLRALPPVTKQGAPPPRPGRRSTEQSVAAIWAEALGIADLDPADRFFDVGGSSLLLPQLAMRLSAEFGVPVELIDLFDHSTIAEQAEFLDRAIGSPVTAPGETDEAREAGQEQARQSRSRRARRSAKAADGEGPLSG
jgi:acyl-coenzyme A synthetase/AMP-(fatty) acid ligase/acyl carrier protein